MARPKAQYNPAVIEAKWRKRWDELSLHRAEENSNRPKYYCLDMFPYPSGEGLHVGHWRGYTISDVWSRYKVLQGYQVLHPMGWDAFGLPAENDAIQKGIHPEVSTKRNIATFKRQLTEIGAMFDWSREVNTSDPSYYKWTQWIFLKMYEMGLAYRKRMPINWCPSCRTGLANEEVIGGECERCGTRVTKKELEQWMLRITAYADRLLEDLKELDWPDHVKKMQVDWIGRSEGARVKFPLEQGDECVEVWTSRVDTLFGVTFVVLAPEHPLVERLTTPEQRAAVNAYREETLSKSNVERMAGKEKTGVFTGSYVTHPFTGERVPVWIADYVLVDYGTGAVMGVPAHDTRDFEFAQRFGLPVVEVVRPLQGDGAEAALPYVDDGVLVNSGPFAGLSSAEARRRITEALEEKGLGRAEISYRMRDWVFSRQRYWGEPIPIVFCDRCGEQPVPYDQLPVLLPRVEKYQPTGTGESPLAAIPEFVNTTCPKCGGPARRETHTMPQWAGSCWYFLRYADPQNDQAPWDREKLAYWLPVDLYVGGVEHAVLHLLYARFFTKVLYDLGLVPFKEPFKKLFNQGMICRNGAKMSKSKGNGVSPDGLVSTYGTDALRLYELFIAPPEVDADWDDTGIQGTYRFLNRVWTLVHDFLELEPGGAPDDPDVASAIARTQHRFLATIAERLESFRLNTAVSAMMEFLNELSDLPWRKAPKACRQALCDFLVVLAPFAPHTAEELWEQMGHGESIFRARWPEADPALAQAQTVEVPVQVNGRVRTVLELEKGLDESTVLDRAREAVRDYLGGKAVVRTIYVPEKVINFVVR